MDHPTHLAEKKSFTHLRGHSHFRDQILNLGRSAEVHWRRDEPWLGCMFSNPKPKAHCGITIVIHESIAAFGPSSLIHFFLLGMLLSPWWPRSIPFTPESSTLVTQSLSSESPILLFASLFLSLRLLGDNRESRRAALSCKGSFLKAKLLCHISLHPTLCPYQPGAWHSLCICWLKWNVTLRY